MINFCKKLLGRLFLKNKLLQNCFLKNFSLINSLFFKVKSLKTQRKNYSKYKIYKKLLKKILYRNITIFFTFILTLSITNLRAFGQTKKIKNQNEIINYGQYSNNNQQILNQDQQIKQNQSYNIISTQNNLEKNTGQIRMGLHNGFVRFVMEIKEDKIVALKQNYKEINTLMQNKSKKKRRGNNNNEEDDIESNPKYTNNNWNINKYWLSYHDKKDNKKHANQNTNNNESNILKIVIKNSKIEYFNVKDNSKTKSPFENITSSVEKNGDTVITAELKNNVKIINTSYIPKDKQNGYRFVLDIAVPEEKDNFDTISKLITMIDNTENIAKYNLDNAKDYDPKLSAIVMDEVMNEEVAEENNTKIHYKQKQKTSDKISKTTTVIYKNTKPVVVIDAGHGGSDPGTIGGRYHTREKDLTMRYALLVYAKLKKLGYDVKLTRRGDYTLDLKERRDISSHHNADLFISLHADHHPNKDTRGLSVYTLSNSSSDEVAKKLAESHEEGQVIGGIKFDEKDPTLSSIVVDLERSKSTAESVRFAELIVKEMKQKHVQMLFNTHRFAGFAVLKGADVPSVLIEIGFLSNKNEEGLLKSQTHKQKVTDAIVDSIQNYFETKK